MFYWLVQSQEAHPDLAQGIPPDGLLNAVEQARFTTLKTEKRRRDWLLGRWTAKHLLQNVVCETGGECFPLNEFTIGNNVDGAPTVNYQLPITNFHFELSISHSHGHAFCAVAERPIGADIEWIEPRSEAFIADYFTEAEQALVARAVSTFEFRVSSLALPTVIWSAKEAVLKALHLGLRVDTRAVNCVIEPFAEPPAKWLPFGVEINKTFLNVDCILQGWWCIKNGYALTVVINTIPSSSVTLPPRSFLVEDC